MTQSPTKTIKTTDGRTIQTIKVGEKTLFHSMDGPAIKYPKSMKQQDEYYIYGHQYTKEKWLEAVEDVKVKYMPIDPNLE